MYFAGSGEGRPDVEIYGSIYNIANNLWSEPKSYLDSKRLSKDSKHFIKKIGNPVIYKAANGNIHFFVVGVSFGGWATSKIYHYISSDNAKTFSYNGVLQLGTFANLSHLVRSNPVGLEDGGFYLPIYHEFAKKYPLIIRFDKDGKMLYVKKLTTINKILQPSIAPLDSQTCLAVFRNYHDGAMKMQKCNEGGLTWDTPQESNIINEGNSLALFALNNAIYLLHNTRENTPNEPRGTLALSLFQENKWQQIAILDTAQGIRENEKSVEVSYPNVIVNKDIVDIVYTNNRTHISHIRLNAQWIQAHINQAQREKEEQ